MATTTRSAAALAVTRREPSGSRAARRLRREGSVPGVVYGGGGEPIPFKVDERALRLALQHAGAVLDLSIDGEAPMPVVVKELARHPVGGEVVHIDLLRVRLDRPIHATVALELTGAEAAPGVREGGVLEHVTRELTVEALPNDIPDVLEHDVSEMAIGDIVTFAQLRAPDNVRLVGDPETVIATLTPPRLHVAEQAEIEHETELVGAEGEQVPEGEGEASGAGQAAGAGQAGGEDGAGGE